MVNFALERELRNYLAALEPDQQRQVLEFAKSLGSGRANGVPGHDLLRFVGVLDTEEAKTLAKAVEDCEAIDRDGW